MSNFALEIMYDGTNFHGWQRQENGITVQQAVEEALSKLMGQEISVCGCSRTDSGVHALSYVLNFSVDKDILPDKIVLAFNNLVQTEEIRARKCIIVSDDFSARFSNDGKTYVYKIWNSKIKNPFTAKYSWYVPFLLDFEKMEQAAREFEGTYDFTAFMAKGGSQKSTVRTVNKCIVKRSRDWSEQIELEIEANAYLYNMVRIITGTVVYCGMGKIDPGDIKKIIESRDRTLAGVTAPPQGLFLKEVKYENR